MTTEEQEAADKAAEDKAVTDKAAADAKAAAASKTYSQEHMDKVRREAAEARVEAKALREEKEAAEVERQKKNGEYEKLARDAEAKTLRAEKRIADLEASTKVRLFSVELRSAAIAAGIDDIDDVKLIDVGNVSELDDEELTQHAESLVKKFKAAKPKKFQKETIVDDENVERLSNVRAKPKSTPVTNNGNKPAAKDAKDMTKLEFDAAWAAL